MALRKNQRFDHNTKGFITLLRVGPAKGVRVLRRLRAEGYLAKNLADDTWANTIPGNALAIASAAPRISRTTAEKALAGLCARAAAINRDDQFAFCVERITVFGSYLTSRQRLGDVDVAILLRQRYKEQAKQAAGVKQAIERNPGGRSAFTRLFQPEQEVWKLLKGRARTLQFVERIPDGARCRVVFADGRKLL